MSKRVAIRHIDGDPRNNARDNLQLVNVKTSKPLSDNQKLKLAIEALKIADGVMEYCQGDKWERECTEKDRKKFAAIFEQLC